MEQELLKGIHPFYSMSLHRAARVALHEGKITQEQADTINGVIRSPLRKSEDGRTCDILEEARQHTAVIAAHDPNLSAEERNQAFNFSFDWSSIWTWIKDHLPQILQCIASLLSIFILLV